MPPMPAAAEAPPDLLTPRTARPASSARRAIASSAPMSGNSRSTRSRSGKFFASKAWSASPAYLSSGATRAVAAHVVGRYHRLLASDQHAETHVVALGALRFLDRAVAHVDRLRHRAHRHRVRGIGAGRAGSLDEPLGERDQLGLVEQG